MIQNITQLRRIIFRKYSSSTSTWDVFTLEADDLGQDTVLSLNVAPRKRSRASSLGTTESTIAGTFDSFSASITFLMDTFKNLGQAIQMWNEATYAGASATAGNIVWDGTNICTEGDYMSVVAQGLCDDGSTADVELTRCIPSVDDAIEIGTGDTPTITLNLHPIIYNSALHSSDGYPQYSARLGDYDLTTKKRLNVTTGVYDTVTPSA